MTPRRSSLPLALHASLVALAAVVWTLLAVPAHASLPRLGDLARIGEELQGRPALPASELDQTRALPEACTGESCIESTLPKTRVRGFGLRLSCFVGGEAVLTCGPRLVYRPRYGGGASGLSVFTGHQWDEETDLYYAKARYYDPELGRFLTQDSFLGQTDNPPSLHRYFYANDNPVRYVDPTGHANEEMEYEGWEPIFGAEGATYPKHYFSETVPVTAPVDPVREIGRNVETATAFPRKVAEGGARLGLNIVTAGGSGGIERAVAEGRANPDDLSSIATAYNQGNANFLTAGGADAYVEARAGQGKGQAASVLDATVTAPVNLTPYHEGMTLLDPNASGYDKAGALLSGGLKIFAAGTAIKRGYTVLKENRSTVSVGRPTPPGEPVRPTNDYDGAAWDAYHKANPTEMRSVGAAGNSAREGRYEFPDQKAEGTPYVGQSVNIPRRLSQHEKAGRLARGTETTVEVLGGKTAREVAEHKRIQEITGGVPARQSAKVSNKVDPVGPDRQHLLKKE